MKFKFKKPGTPDFLEFEAELKDFNSKKVIYQEPEVWRLWIQVGEFRVNFHKIFKSETQELFHPHPWPMNTLILDGSCEVGFGVGEHAPELLTTATFEKNSSYEMLQPQLWHYVKPLTPSILTVMVSGKPWDNLTKFNIFPTEAQPELTPEEKFMLWNEITLLLYAKEIKELSK